MFVTRGMFYLDCLEDSQFADLILEILHFYSHDPYWGFGLAAARGVAFGPLRAFGDLGDLFG